MLALGAVMFVEKVVSWGRWLTIPVGILLVVWGVALLAQLPGVPRPF
jgi:predicted metal-binding membrane protein